MDSLDSFDESLPSHRLVVRGGRLHSLETYFTLHGEPSGTLELTRQLDGNFVSEINDPEDGDSTEKGTLKDLTRDLAPNMRDPIRRGFSLEEATEASLEAVGLTGYEIVFDPPELPPERNPGSVTIEVPCADEHGMLDKPVEKGVILAAINKFYERTEYPPVDDLIREEEIRELGMYTLEIQSRNGSELIKLWVIPTR